MNIIINNNKIELINGNNFYNRLIGLMFKKYIKKGLYLPNCNSIHTFFMKENIDLIMLDKNNIVIDYKIDFCKNKIYYKKEVQHIIELPKNTISNINIGDKINIEYPK